ncbi:hypothetical protein ACFX14_032189 [Malus domestica]
MVSSCSTPGFPPVHAHPTRLPTMDARLSAALDFLVASMRADLRAIRDSDFAFYKAVESAVAPIRRHLALLRHDLALGAGEGSGPASMSFDDVEIPDLGHQKLPRLGIQDREGSPHRIPSKIQVHSIPSLLLSSPLLQAMANSLVQPSHLNDFVSATVPWWNVEKTRPIVMVTTTPLLFPISAIFSTKSAHAHSHKPVLSTTKATIVAHVLGFPFKNVGATKSVGLSHTNTMKRRDEVLRSLIYNLSHGKVKWHWILNSLLACYTDGKVGMNDVYLNKIHRWVGLYEVGKFVMVFNAEKVLDEIAKRQSEDAAGNLFDRMTPLFHNMVICSQFCINIGEFWNGWDPGGGLAKILGVMLYSKNHENHGDKYPQFLKTQLHFINHPMHFTCLRQVMQYEKSTATCESVFNISGDRNFFIDAGNAGKLDKVLNVVDSMLDDDGVEFFTNPNKKTMLFLNLTDLKVLVTDNIQEYVKSGKYVLLEFYAPWCGHCKKFPILHEVVVSDEKDSDVVIAKLRATVNGVPSDFDVKYF